MARDKKSLKNEYVEFQLLPFETRTMLTEGLRALLFDRGK